jgi:hypothetical protein
MSVLFILWKFKLLVCVLLYQLSYTAGMTIQPPVYSNYNEDWTISIKILNSETRNQEGLVNVVPLIFFAKMGANVDEDVTDECEDMCCMARATNLRVWKGDISTLNMLTTQCDNSLGGNPTWSNLTELADREEKTDFSLTLTQADLKGDNSRTEYGKHSRYHTNSKDYEVSVLVLSVQKWTNIDAAGESILFVDFFQRVSIDFKQTNEITSAVDVDLPCLNQKPANSFYVAQRLALSTDSSKCEWFCNANYIRCPLYATDDEASCVTRAASTSRVYFMKVGIRSLQGGINQPEIDIFNQTSQLQKMSEQFSTSLASDEIIVRGCLLSFTTENLLKKARLTYDTVTSGVKLDRATALQLTETFAIIGDMSPVRMNPASQIAYSIDDQDRYDSGFLEYHVLIYIESERERSAEHGKLRVQADNIRRNLNNFFMNGNGDATVLYVSNVDVLDRGFKETEYITTWNIMLFVFWGVVIVLLLLWNLMCPSGVSNCSDVSCGSRSNNDGSCINRQHSPYGACIILIFCVVIFVAFLGLLFNYLWVLLPNVNIAPGRQSFMALAFFGATLLPAIALYVCVCTCLQICLTRIK